MITERFLKSALTSGFIIISRYLWRYLVSTSTSPWYFSGSGLIDFVAKLSSFTCIENSPVFVIKA